MAKTLRLRNGWTPRHAFAAAGLLAASVLVAATAWADLARRAWFDEESSHILLVPLVVAWLIWIRRGRWRHCRPGGPGVGTLHLAAGWLFWSIGYRWQIESFWHGGAVLMAVGALLTVLGRDVFFKFWPAFAVLVFLVPVPATGRAYIAVPLQGVTAHVTQTVAEVIGMNVQCQGNVLNVNGTDVAIAEACNGMRMVFTLFLACYAFAFVTPLRGYARVLVLAFSPVVAIGANVVRLVPTVWMFGHVSRHAAEIFHDVGGWVMLAAAFFALLSILRVLRWAMLPVTEFVLAAS